MNELDLVDLPKVKEPCAAARKQLDAHGNERHLPLSKLTGIKGQCVWCEAKLPNNRSRWCGPDCVVSAQFMCFPQLSDAKMHRLIFIQQWACAGCGVSFEAEIRKMIVKKHKNWNSNKYHYPGGTVENKVPAPIENISLWQLGNNTGDKWHTDHIVPIHKGGKGIDPANLQVLCVPCHKVKTKTDHLIIGEPDEHSVTTN